MKIEYDLSIKYEKNTYADSVQTLSFKCELTLNYNYLDFNGTLNICLQILRKLQNSRGHKT